MTTDKMIQSKKKLRLNHQPKDPMRPQDDARLMKALEIAKFVTATTSTTATVRSRSDPNKEYHVILSDDGKHECECPDNRYRKVVCLHIRAFLISKAKTIHDINVLNQQGISI
jgi:hypothetical protein